MRPSTVRLAQLFKMTKQTRPVLDSVRKIVSKVSQLRRQAQFRMRRIIHKLTWKAPRLPFVWLHGNIHETYIFVVNPVPVGGS